MEGWEVAVLIIFIILILAGVGIGIYFVWRYEQNKNTNNSPPNSNTGTTGTTGTTGMTGSNMFSITPQSAPNMFLTYDPNNPIFVNSNTIFPIVATNGTTLKCADYEWSTFSFGGVPSVLGLKNQTIIQTGYTRPQVINATGSLTGPAILASTSDLLANWIYTADKRWCSPDIYCLYYNSDNTVTIENINNVNLNLANFVWNNISPISPPICST